MRKEVMISLMDLLFEEVNSKDYAIFTKVKRVPVTEDDAIYGDGYKYVDAYYGFVSSFAKYLFHLFNERGCFYSIGYSPITMCTDIKNFDKLCALKISVSLEVGSQGLDLGNSVSVFKVPVIKGELKYNKAELEGGSIVIMLVAMVKHFVDENDQEYVWIVTQQEELEKGQEEVVATIRGDTLVLHLQK